MLGADGREDEMVDAIELVPPSEPLEELVVEFGCKRDLAPTFRVARQDAFDEARSHGVQIYGDMQLRFQTASQKQQNSWISCCPGTRAGCLSCCHSVVKFKCSFCGSPHPGSQLEVFGDGTCHEAALNEEPNQLQRRVKAQFLTLGTSVAKAFSLADFPPHPLFTVPICETCSAALELHRNFLTRSEEISAAEKFEFIGVYNVCFAEWSMLKHLSENHLALCRQMKRCRSQFVEYQFDNSNDKIQKQRALVRTYCDQLRSFGQSTRPGRLQNLQLIIASFIQTSCSLMADEISRANEDVTTFLLLECKVMGTQIPVTGGPPVKQKPPSTPNADSFACAMTSWLSSFMPAWKASSATPMPAPPPPPPPPPVSRSAKQYNAGFVTR